MIEKLVNHPEIIKFCDNIKKFNLNKKEKLCGFDYNADYLNFKLYIGLTEVPSREILANFLNDHNTNSFLNYSQFWNKHRDASLALGLKVDSNNNIKSYYHIKFDINFPESNYLNNFNFLKLFNIELTSLLKGISVEIDKDNKEYKKYYVYIKNQTDIEKILRYKGLKGFKLKEIEELELYTAKDKFKINIINKMNDFIIQQNIWSIIPEKYLSSIKKCSEILNSPPSYNGATSTNIVSVYFSLTNKSNNILNI